MWTTDPYISLTDANGVQTRIIRAVSHMGGNKQETLVNAYYEVGQSLQRAITALANIYHERDFYVWGDDALNKSRDEAKSRVRILQVVLEEIDAMTEAVAMQNTAGELFLGDKSSYEPTFSFHHTRGDEGKS